MKVRTLITLFALFMGTLFARAIKVGDYMEIDETPCVVIYVDETGEHGLVMSRCVVSLEFATKDAKRLVKIGGLKKEDMSEYIRLNAVDRTQYLKQKKNKEAYKEKIFSELMPRLGEYGEENQKAIVQFCEEKGLTLAYEFPEIAWADALGEGWFIPGDYELELYATLYAGGLRDTHALPRAEYLNRYKELTESERAGAIMRSPAFHGAWSSTCKYPKCGFRGMTRTERDMKNWMQIFDVINKDTDEPATMAMKRF